MMFRWWRAFGPATPRGLSRSGCRGIAPSGGHCPLCLERLEDRCLLNAGALDLGFGASGKLTTVFPGSLGSSARATALQADGKIVAAGSVTNSGTGADFALVRYNPDGSLDATFGGGGRVSTDFAGGADDAYGVAIQSD